MFTTVILNYKQYSLEEVGVEWFG